MALVIKKWYAGKQVDSNGNYIHLIGREAGIFSWILSLMGVDPTTEVEVKEKVILFSSASLAGQEKRVIPMKSVCSAFYGYKKPWKEALAIGLILLPLFGLGLIVGPLYYFLNKTLSVAVVEKSAWVGGFSFKRSVIEGQNITENEAYKVIDILRWIIEEKTL